MSQNCLICGSHDTKQTPAPSNTPKEDGDIDISCPICGIYRLSEEALDEYLNRLGAKNKSLTTPRVALIAHLLRTNKDLPRVKRSSSSVEYINLISAEFLDRIINDEFSLPTPPVLAKKLLRLIGEQERKKGRTATIEPWYASEIGAVSQEKVVRLVEEMVDLGWLHQDLAVFPDGKSATDLQLTMRGWQEWEEITKGKRSNNRGFIAMQFGDPKLDKFINEVVKPGIMSRLGLHIERVDDNPEAGIIDNRMRQLIQDAAFVIADLTHGNSGAYWEAGYAEGLGKPVIYLCEKKAFEDRNIHFDVNHCMTVMWSEDAPAQAVDLLAATIQNSLPRL
jgi:hypothetical protein